MSNDQIKTLCGYPAIEYASANGLTLNKYADPIEGARSGLSVREAREIAHDDANLIWIEADLPPQRFTWTATIEIEVDRVWVADGFELTPDRLNRMLARMIEYELGYATPDEVFARGSVTAAPSADAIRAAQGYGPSEGKR